MAAAAPSGGLVGANARSTYLTWPWSTSEMVVVPVGFTVTGPVLLVESTLPLPAVKSYVVTVKTWLPAGTLNEAEQTYAADTAGLGEQFGDCGVRLTMMPFAPSTRTCSDCVLGETSRLNHAGLGLGSDADGERHVCRSGLRGLRRAGANSCLNRRRSRP